MIFGTKYTGLEYLYQIPIFLVYSQHVLDKVDVDILPLEVGDGLHAGLLDVLLDLLQ
jgi:hypothetical protein